MKKIIIFILITSFLFAGRGSAQSPQELRTFLPEIKGWKLTAEIEVFNRENLYNRINGAAPLFLENNFQEMTSVVCTQGNDYITIQMYRHATPVDAFGMYASERSSELSYFPIGGEAQGDNTGLYFFAGNVYVKMQANNESETIGKTMQEIGKALAEKIDPQASYPAVFNYFPSQAKVSYSQAYIASNYIGHEFLKSVYICDYSYNGKKLQAFLVDGKNKEGAQAILKQYFSFTKQPDNFSEGPLLMKDKFNGNIPCVWQGRYILGVFSEDGEDVDGDIIQYLSEISLPD